MILVATGMLRLGFDRLVRGVDKLVEEGAISNDVFIQIGFSKYKPIHCSYKSVVSLEQMDRLLDDCSVLITHGGAGLISDGLEKYKPVIAVPRRKKYREHINDHQLELTNELEKEGRIIVVNKVSDLPKAIYSVKNMDQFYHQPECKIQNIIKDFLDTLQNWGHSFEN